MIDELQYVQLMNHNMVLLADNRKALADVERLQKMVESLKNCANCSLSYSTDIWYCAHGTKNKVEAMNHPISADHVCDKWESGE